jgi:hypothetical protein
MPFRPMRIIGRNAFSWLLVGRCGRRGRPSRAFFSLEEEKDWKWAGSSVPGVPGLAEPRVPPPPIP